MQGNANFWRRVEIDMSQDDLLAEFLECKL